MRLPSWSMKRGSIFGVESSTTLALFRFLYCGAVAFEIAGNASFTEDAYREERAYHAIPLFAEISPEPISVFAASILRWFTVAVLTLAACGILTRPALVLSFASFFVYEGFALGFEKAPGSDYVYHMSNLTVFALAILMIAPGVDRHGVDSWRRGRFAATYAPEWPRKTILGLLALAYLGACYCRLADGVGWLDGYTIQGYLFERALRHDLPHSFELAQSHVACFLFGLGTVLFEATFVAVLFFPRLAYFFVPAGILLHFSIRHFMRIDFFEFFILNYLAFLEWPALRDLGRRLFRREPVHRELLNTSFRARELVPVGARAAVIGILLMQAGCIVGRIENWPFSDFRVYAKRNHPDDVRLLVLGRDAPPESPSLLPHRDQQEFRRAVANSRLKTHAAAAVRDPAALTEDDIDRIRDVTIKGLMRTRPEHLDDPRGLALFLEYLAFDPTRDRYEVVFDRVAVLVPRADGLR